MRRACSLVLSFLAAACSSAPKAPAAKNDAPDAQSSADAGVVAAESCGPGTMPRLGQTTCAAVGPTTIPEGFELAADGWGFQPVLPTAVCTSGTDAALGQTSCVPVDDCSATFPPASADVVVSQSAPSGGKTYVTSIADALAAVPAGGTIALDAGTYPPIKIAQNVQLLGRCASQVNIAYAGSGSEGLLVEGGKVTVSHLTVSGFEVGIEVVGVGTSLTASAVHLSNNSGSVIIGSGGVASISQSAIEGPAPNPAITGVLGVGVFGGAPALGSPAGAKLSLNAVDIRSVGTAFGAYFPGSTLSVTRSVVTDERAGETDPTVLDAWGGSTVSISESYLTARVGNLAAVYHVESGSPTSYNKFPAANVTIDSSVLVQSGAEAKVAELLVQDKASLTLTNSIVRHQSEAALLGSGNALVTLDRVAIVASPIVADDRIGGLFIEGAQATFQSSVVAEAQAYGLSVDGFGSKLTLNDSLVLNTQFRKPGLDATFGGAGIAVVVDQNALFEATGSAFVGNEGDSIGAGSQAALTMTSCIVDRTLSVSGAPAQSGLGLDISWAELFLSGSLVRNSGDSALMFDFPQGGAVLSNDTLVGNAVGLRTLMGMTVDQATSAPLSPTAGTVTLYETSLAGNTEAQGTTIPLLGDAGGPPPVTLDGGY